VARDLILPPKNSGRGADAADRLLLVVVEALVMAVALGVTGVEEEGVGASAMWGIAVMVSPPFGCAMFKKREGCGVCVVCERGRRREGEEKEGRSQRSG